MLENIINKFIINLNLHYCVEITFSNIETIHKNYISDNYNNIMKKSIFKIMLLGSVIFGVSQANASTIADETISQDKMEMVNEDPRVQCVIDVLVRGREMEGVYSQETLDRILQTEMEKCADGSHSTLSDSE